MLGLKDLAYSRKQVNEVLLGDANGFWAYPFSCLAISGFESQ
jgi:hypothetical protein